ncbi:MAG: DUF3782 domain-containing protein [Treponema sp.]|jgi:hypothetical protein|nr:DUF3782 domain-containing protein [Treponema sp.]
MQAQAVNNTPPTGEGLTYEKVWAMFQEIARRQEETARRQEETDRQMKETDRRIGELGNRFGELAEHLVVPGIAKRFNELGYHFEAASPGGYKIFDENGKTKTEVDILLENSNYLIAVEVKSRVQIKDIDHHIKRLEILKEHRLKKNDNRIILGAMAGAVFGNVEKTAVAEAGFYVIEQSGDTMKIDVPDDFSPREW